MNGAETQQLRLIAESAAGYVARNGGAARARQLRDNGGDFDAEGWRGIAGMGWLGIAVPESAGGLELGPAAACVIAEEAGRGLMMAPLTMGIAAANLLSRSADQAAGEALHSLLDGKQHVALAVANAPGRAGQPVQAAHIPDGPAARHLVIGVGRGAKFEARLIAHDAAGVTSTAEVCVDGSRLATVSVEPTAWVAAPVLVAGSDGHESWGHALNLFSLGDAAYLCGLMDSVLKLSLDYLRLRRQFGVPIGSFQALQHRAASCHIDTAATRALVFEATRAFGAPRERWAAAASASRAAAAALRVMKEVVQFHGAIGFADEHDAGLYLRRAMVIGARHAGDALHALQSAA